MNRIDSRVVPKGIQVISDTDTSHVGFYILQDTTKIHTYAPYVRRVDSDKGQNRMILCQRVGKGGEYEVRKVCALLHNAQSLKENLNKILSRMDERMIGSLLEEDLQFAIKQLEQYFQISEITKIPWAIDKEIYQILTR